MIIYRKIKKVNDPTRRGTYAFTAYYYTRRRRNRSSLILYGFNKSKKIDVAEEQRSQNRPRILL